MFPKHWECMRSSASWIPPRSYHLPLPSQVSQSPLPHGIWLPIPSPLGSPWVSVHLPGPSLLTEGRDSFILTVARQLRVSRRGLEVKGIALSYVLGEVLLVQDPCGHR